MDTSGVIRRLATFERDRTRDHLLRLEEEDRHLRFGGHATLERVGAHCAGLDLARTVVLGYMVAGEARGIGELGPLPRAWRGPPRSRSRSSVRFRGRGSAARCCGA